MTKSKSTTPPSWIRNLRTLMEQRGYNPRSLSIKAGLNATAVRDMIEGRSRYPRYDTARSLAQALDTTPALLMSDGDITNDVALLGQNFSQDLELLTEILSRLKEVTAELDRNLSPRDFAAMTATIYRRMQDNQDEKIKISSIRPHIIDLLNFEALKQKKPRR